MNHWTRTATTAGGATATRPPGSRSTRTAATSSSRTPACPSGSTTWSPNLVDPDDSNGLPGSHTPRAALLHLRKAARPGADRRSTRSGGSSTAVRTSTSSLAAASSSSTSTTSARRARSATSNCRSRRSAAPLHVFGGLDATGGNKGAEVKLGCALRICVGDAAPRDSELQALRRGAAAPLPDAAGDATDVHGGPEEAGAHAAGQPPGLEGPGARGLKGLKKPVRATAPLLEHSALTSSCGGAGAPGDTAIGLRRAAAGSARGEARGRVPVAGPLDHLPAPGADNRRRPLHRQARPRRGGALDHRRALGRRRRSRAGAARRSASSTSRRSSRRSRSAAPRPRVTAARARSTATSRSRAGASSSSTSRPRAG